MTGGSEGIGRQFCLDLARCGFNIAVSSRSQAKLEAVEQELKAVSPEVEVRTRSIDFSKETDYSGVVGDKEVMDNLALVVNNVGFLKLQKCFDVDPGTI